MTSASLFFKLMREDLEKPPLGAGPHRSGKLFRLSGFSGFYGRKG